MPRFDAIIDASNVARDNGLGGGHKDALFARYKGVCEAWLRQFPERKGIHGVADSNLRHHMEEPDQDEFDAQVRRGRITEVKGGDADSAILDLAQRHRAMVISLDDFVDYRKTDGNCWIQGNTHQFFGWQGSLEAGIQLRQRDMGYKTTEKIKQKQRKTSAKARKATPQTLLDEAKSLFRCSNHAGQCVYAGDGYLPAGVNPTYESGEPACPNCGKLLERFRVDGTPSDPRKINGTGARVDGPAPANVVADDDEEQLPHEGGSVPPLVGTHRAKADDLVDVSTWPATSACLQIWRRGVERQRVELPRDRLIVFGRTRDVFDLRPFTDDDRVFISRQHLQIAQDNEGQAHLTDLGSTHGTWLNADRVNPHNAEQLKDGDEITLAGDVVTLVYWAPRDR